MLCTRRGTNLVLANLVWCYYCCFVFAFFCCLKQIKLDLKFKYEEVVSEFVCCFYSLNL